MRPTAISVHVTLAKGRMSQHRFFIVLPDDLCHQVKPIDQMKSKKNPEDPVPVVNQIRTYWWCSPPRTGRQRMLPARSTARETGGGAALRTQQRGQGIPVGSNRSAVRRIHFATGSVATLVGRECPSIEVVG